jgi:SOS response regulatory protein OraA/RecX
MLTDSIKANDTAQEITVLIERLKQPFIDRETINSVIGLLEEMNALELEAVLANYINSIVLTL